VVYPGVMEKTQEYYQQYVANPSQIEFVTNISAAHAIVTDNYGNDCSYFGSPYINNCGFDSAAAMLTHFYGNLNQKKNFSSSNVGNMYCYLLNSPDCCFQSKPLHTT
jgi:hypothetical protein